MTIHYTADIILYCFITVTHLIRETFTSENGGDTNASPAPPINHNEFQPRVPFDVYHGQ